LFDETEAATLLLLGLLLVAVPPLIEEGTSILRPTTKQLDRQPAELLLEFFQRAQIVDRKVHRLRLLRSSCLRYCARGVPWTVNDDDAFVSELSCALP